MNEPPKHRIERVASGNPAMQQARAAVETAAAHEDAVARVARSLSGGNGAEDAVQVELADGRVVEISQPKRSIAALVTMIAAELTERMGAGSPRSQLIALTALSPHIEAILHVRSIEGVKVESVMTALQYESLADRLTDSGLRAVETAIARHWPQATQETAGLVKKNQPERPLS
jgi:hypothetical protein